MSSRTAGAQPNKVHPRGTLIEAKCIGRDPSVLTKVRTGYVVRLGSEPLIVPPDLYNFTILFLLWEAIGIVRRNLFWPDNSRVIRRRPARRRPPITVSGAGHRCCTATWSVRRACGAGGEPRLAQLPAAQRSRDRGDSGRRTPGGPIRTRPAVVGSSGGAACSGVFSSCAKAARASRRGPLGLFVRC
jgi:hypothetical protein